MAIAACWCAIPNTLACAPCLLSPQTHLPCLAFAVLAVHADRSQLVKQLSQLGIRHRYWDSLRALPHRLGGIAGLRSSSNGEETSPKTSVAKRARHDVEAGTAPMAPTLMQTDVEVAEPSEASLRPPSLGLSSKNSADEFVLPSTASPYAPSASSWSNQDSTVRSAALLSSICDM